jgi:C4-dicarboxylate transporter DctM subunit
MFPFGIVLTLLSWSIGFPIWIAFVLGGLFLLVFWQGQPILTFPHIFYQGMDSYSLLALPFFLLSGQMMITGGASKALFRWIESFVGHLTGGLAIAAVVACMLFGTISGSTLATMAAIGSMAIPVMIEKGYDKKYALGLLCASGSLGNLIPPSIFCVLFASLTGAPIDILFFAGFFPGIILTIMLSIMAYIIFKWKGTASLPPASWAERWKSTIYALPALSIPVVILGGIYSGIMTPVEAAATSVFITIPVSIIYKSFNLKTTFDAMKKAMVTTSMIYFILGGTILFINVLTYAEVPQYLITLVEQIKLSQNQLILIMLGLLLVLDMMMEPVPMLFLVVPLTSKVIFGSGIHWITFNFMLLQYSAIAFITPPIAMALFVMSQMFHARIEDVTKGVLPFLAVLIIHIFIFLFFPEFLLWLPRLVFGPRADIPVTF